MGTHPIFESDFDCLTEIAIMKFVAIILLSNFIMDGAIVTRRGKGLKRRKKVHIENEDGNLSTEMAMRRMEEVINTLAAEFKFELKGLSHKIDKKIDFLDFFGTGPYRCFRENMEKLEK